MAKTSDVHQTPHRRLNSARDAGDARASPCDVIEPSLNVALFCYPENGINVQGSAMPQHRLAGELGAPTCLSSSPYLVGNEDTTSVDTGHCVP